MSYESAMAAPIKRFKKIRKSNIIFTTLVKILSFFDLKKTNFKLEKINMDRINKKEPCLYLMNHCSFIDLKIAMSILYPKPINIVTTSDGFVSKNWLLRQLGCFPTKKYVTDPKLVKQMIHCVKNMKSNVLMYPETGYTFDGSTTTMPDSFGKLAKMMNVPIVLILSKGASLRQPLFNELRLRDVDVEATMECIITKEDIERLSADEINKIVKDKFVYDDYRYQQEKGMIIDEEERAVGLNKILYKCPNCMHEGNMISEKHYIICPECKKEYELTETGFMKAKEGKTEIDHIPNWYKWERECVRKEIEDGTYFYEDDVSILMMKDTYNLYDLGDGHLIHDIDGFKLTGSDGKLNFKLDSKTSYSICSDFYWYEIDDIVCIGDNKQLFFLFPKTKKDVVAKLRLATEEIYKYKNNI